MTPAGNATQPPRDARLLVVDAGGRITHHARSALVERLRPGDVLVANDAATMPASLRGTHAPSGAEIEVRLAGRRSLAVDDVHAFTAIVFGVGDHRVRTEDRPAPPALRAGDALLLGPLCARVAGTLGSARLIALRFEGDADAIWAGIARHGRPIQYAHVEAPLHLWDTWTRFAALPVAFEPPSAGFALDWRSLAALRARGVGFATLTHAAGISSTGDPALDARLPFDEPYFIPAATVAAIERAHTLAARVIALGTTVTRALEHSAASPGGLRAGSGLATQRIGPASTLAVVDALVTGVHEAGSSHHALLRAFVDEGRLQRIDAALERHAYRSHEFGDSVLIERALPVRTNAMTPGKQRDPEPLATTASH